ncbi:phosphotyrosine protein phosphatase [Actinoplanes sp. NPDC049548]|uniref:arsenate reductase/protein-tyrosine-phosphatase family protein n=1 Tax=Actinoplanes sp. NPDC049548 TaxID=3155152 RepID=UPI00343B39C2
MPFTVLHVCMGNICRSPMAERLLVLAARQRLAKLDPDARLGDLLRSASAGTGGWHEGEEMNPPAARQIRLRGGSVEGFTARKLTSGHLTDADLILTATADQSDYVHALVPDAAARTFVLGHFGRLLRELDVTALPPAGTEPQAFAARAAALVEAAGRRRGADESLPGDDLDDPWGRGDQTFQRIADDIDEMMYALVDALLPGGPRPA